MKNKTLLFALLVLFALPLFAQQKLSPEHAAIKQVIEDETKHFMACDYDQWAACVAHDDMTYFSYTSPFHGENAIWEAQGWEQVSKETKEFMEENKPTDKLPKKTDYKFKVKGDMAYVTFTEDDRLAETRVLEKVDGQWKILRMEATNSKAFKNFHQLYALQRMAGNWEVDMSTYKKEGGGSWAYLGGTMDIKRTPTGFSTVTHVILRNKEGELRITEEQGMASFNMETGMVGWSNSVQYPYSNWTEAYQAIGKFDEDGKLKMNGSPVGGSSEAAFEVWMDGDVMHYAVEVMAEGQKVYAASYEMKRTDLAKARP